MRGKCRSSVLLHAVSSGAGKEHCAGWWGGERRDRLGRGDDPRSVCTKRVAFALGRGAKRSQIAP